MEDRITISLIFFTSIPILFASSSFRVRRLILHLRSIIGTRPITIGKNAKTKSFIFIEESEPISQYVIAGSWSSVSAISFTRLVPLENRELIITPANTRERVESILLFLATIIASKTATKPKEKEERVIIKYPPPSNMARAAPNPAPVEAPNRSGDTIGLRKIP